MKISKLHTKTQAFTIPELVVVIVILAVLSTVGFLSYTSYTSQARDTLRITDVESIETTLNFFNAYSSKFPSPSSSVNVEHMKNELFGLNEFFEQVQWLKPEKFFEI